MIEVVKMTVQHLYELEKKMPKHPAWQGLVTRESREALAGAESFAIVTPDGDIQMCGGIVEYWKNRGEVWALMAPSAGRYILSIHRAVLKFLNGHESRRIEAAVDVTFAKGRRWVESLGFVKEADRLRAYLPGGEDCAMYARVRG